MDYGRNANPATYGENKGFHSLLSKSVLLPTVFTECFQLIRYQKF